MSEDTKPESEMAKASVTDMAESLHARHIQQLFGLGSRGWASFGHGYFTRVITAPQGQQFTWHDRDRLHTWIKDNLPNIGYPTVSFTRSALTSGSNVPSTMRVTIGSEAMSLLKLYYGLGKQDVGELINHLPHPQRKPQKENDMLLVFDTQVRASLLNRKAWHNNRHNTLLAPQNRCSIQLERSIVDAIIDPETGEVGSLKTLKQEVSQRFSKLFGDVPHTMLVREESTGIVYLDVSVEQEHWGNIQQRLQQERAEPSTNVTMINHLRVPREKSR